MGFVLAAALFSVLVSVLLKLLPRWRIDVSQAVTWNYLVASLLTWVMLDPPREAFQSPEMPWLALVVLALVLPSLFLVQAAAVRLTGIVRTDIAQRLSLLLSLMAAFTLFEEAAGAMKLTGLALGLLAMLLILLRPDNVKADGRSGIWMLLLVWLGFALVDVTLKSISSAGTPFAATLMVSFSLAFAGMLGLQIWRHCSARQRFQARSFGTGLLLGALNFGNIICYVYAHRVLPDSPAVVFATMNIGVVVLGTLVGILGFGERTSRWNKCGIVLAVIAIAVIAYAPRAASAV